MVYGGACPHTLKRVGFQKRKAKNLLSLSSMSQVFIFANLAAMCRMEEYYPRPLEYHPERWLRDDRADMTSNWPKDPAYLCLPFSHGLRACPGRRLAEQSLYTAAIAVSIITN